MTRIGISSIVAGLLVLATGPASLGAEPANSGTADFKEVYELLRAHLAGVSEAELNRAAVQGLISAFSPRVSLVVPKAAGPASPGMPPVSKSSLFEGGIAYVRVGCAEAGLAKAVREACQRLEATNRLKGIVLDLRYAGGQDYSAAAAAADLFLSKERPLLDWGQGVVRSKEKSDAIGVPVAVLVNHQTAGAAEALAAVLREVGVGLILGSPTAGQAMIAQEYPLQDGQRLRIATAPVELGDGAALSHGGVKPDIAVQVSPADERAYYADAYRVLPKTNRLAGARSALTGPALGAATTNRRPRFNEAELVREHREGLDPDSQPAFPEEVEPEKPVVRDPALARALDVLKGLAVVRRLRS